VTQPLQTNIKTGAFTENDGEGIASTIHTSSEHIVILEIECMRTQPRGEAYASLGEL
jgi:hypothetical protein